MYVNDYEFLVIFKNVKRKLYLSKIEICIDLNYFGIILSACFLVLFLSIR